MDSRYSKDTKHNARVVGIMFCLSAICLGSLLFYDAMDGEIRIGGNRGGHPQLITVDSDRDSFIVHVTWIGLLIGVIAIIGIGLIIWGFSHEPVHKRNAVTQRKTQP